MSPRYDICEACGRDFERPKGERSKSWPMCPICDRRYPDFEFNEDVNVYLPPKRGEYQYRAATAAQAARYWKERGKDPFDVDRPWTELETGRLIWKSAP